MAPRGFVVSRVGEPLKQSLGGKPPSALSMLLETLYKRGTTLVRRLVLEPGEATSWHVDPFHRVTVIIRGEKLAIEYRDGADPVRFEVRAGQTDWDAPTERSHRAVNVGATTYEEVAIFFLDRPDAAPQPSST